MILSRSGKRAALEGESFKENMTLRKHCLFVCLFFLCFPKSNGYIGEFDVWFSFVRSFKKEKKMQKQKKRKASFEDLLWLHITALVYIILGL